MKVQVGASPHPRDQLRHLVKDEGFTGGSILAEGLPEADAVAMADSLANVLGCSAKCGAPLPEVGWAVYVASDVSP